MLRPIIILIVLILTGATIALTSAERSISSDNSIKESYHNLKHQVLSKYDFPYSFATVPTDYTQQLHSQSTEMPSQARDSYMDTAASMGYNNIGSEPASAYHYQVYPSYGESQVGYGQSQSPGYGYETEEEGEGGFGKTAIATVLGLIGLKGLKGLGIIKFFKLFPGIGGILPLLPIILLVLGPILLPILLLLSPILFLLKLPLLPILLPLGLPILLPILLLLGLPLLLLLPLLFLLPVPVITFRSLPGQQRINLLESILYRDECMERISCEVGRIINANGFNAPWMRNFIEKSSSKSGWVQRISRAVDSSDCKLYSCGIVNTMKDKFRIGTFLNK